MMRLSYCSGSFWVCRWRGPRWGLQVRWCWKRRGRPQRSWRWWDRWWGLKRAMEKRHDRRLHPLWRDRTSSSNTVPLEHFFILLSSEQRVRIYQITFWYIETLINVLQQGSKSCCCTYQISRSTLDRCQSFAWWSIALPNTSGSCSRNFAQTHSGILLLR